MHFYKMRMKTSLNENVKRVRDLNYTSYIISWFFAKLFFSFLEMFFLKFIECIITQLYPKQVYFSTAA